MGRSSLRGVRNWTVGLCVVTVWIVFAANLAVAAPVCALIDSTQLPVVSLLETRLIADENATWVERNEISRVLGEHELQSAFGAEGIGKRLAIGKLLKADVLVLLRSAKNPVPNGSALLECVICETKNGLRLRTISITSETKAEETADILTSVVRQGLKKYEEKIETIVAVPPFLSEDLGLEYNYLQSSYARLVESRLLEQPGLLVVELKEARAIADEQARALPEVQPHRIKAPLYVIGRYRHDGVGKERTMRMSIRLLQGDKQVTLKGVAELAPVEIPAWISRKANELLPLFQQRTVSTGDFSPQAEARRLAERGKQFQQLGSWQEALELFEASLLLEPNQEDVHRLAVIAITRVIQNNPPYDYDVEQAKRVVAFYLRGLVHLEAYLQTAQDIAHHERLGIAFDRDFHFSVRLKPVPLAPADVREVLALARKVHLDTYLRIARFRAEQRKNDRRDLNTWEHFAVNHLSEQERYDTILRVAEEWRDVPELARRLEWFVFRGIAWLDDTPALRTFLDRLAQSPNEQVRQAGRNIRSGVDRGIADRADLAQRKPPAETTDWDPAIENADIRRSTGERFQIQHCNPIASGMDLVKLNGQAYCMRKKGLLEPYFLPKEQKIHTRSIIYDGRYIWIEGCLFAENKPFLWACDPETGKEHHFTSDDGLPHLNERQTVVKIAPIEPGKICVVGYMGRSWAAIAELSPAETRKVEVFFEARETFEGNAPELAENIKLLFAPEHLVSLRKEGSKELRILVLRKSSASVIADQPLLIDPHKKTVEIPKFKLSGNNDFRYSANDQSSFYLLENNHPKPPHLIRIHFPGEKKEELVAEPPQGILAADHRGIHIIGTEWWVVDRSSGTTTKLVSKVPWYFGGGFVKPGAPNLDFGVDFNKTTLLGDAFSTTHHGIIVKVRKAAEERYFQLNYEKLRPQNKQPVNEAGISP